jgi:hypothetical protein
MTLHSYPAIQGHIMATLMDKTWVQVDLALMCNVNDFVALFEIKNVLSVLCTSRG